MLTKLKNYGHSLVGTLKRKVKNTLTEIKDTLTEPGKLKEPKDVTLTKYSDIAPQGSRIAHLRDNEFLTPNYAKQIGWDLRQKYMLQVKVRGKYEGSDTETVDWFTAESDKLLTMGDWKELLTNAITHSPMGYTYNIKDVLEYMFYERIDKGEINGESD